MRDSHKDDVETREVYAGKAWCDIWRRQVQQSLYLLASTLCVCVCVCVLLSDFLIGSLETTYSACQATLYSEQPHIANLLAQTLTSQILYNDGVPNANA